MAQKELFSSLFFWKMSDRENIWGLLNEPLPTSIINQERHVLAPSQVCSYLCGQRAWEQLGKWDAKQKLEIVKFPYSHSFLKRSVVIVR